MSDHLDERIRELYSELTDGAPDLPPLPAGAPARAGSYRRLALAGGLAVTVLVIGVGIGVLSTLSTSSDDSAALPPPDVAVTRAPDTAAPSAPEVPTGPAAEEPGGQGRPRPVERVLLLADLNRSCAEAGVVFSRDLPARLDTQDDYRTAFGLIFDELEDLRLIVEQANPDLSDDELLEVGDAIMTAQGSVVLGGDEPRTGGYPLDAIEEVAEFLVEFGAIDCSALSSSLP